ncbi:peptidoglycan-binding domain-containing protein [Streptomyces sp. enrichment culture]|uniref:peptidoglycan-binding domain-containing protein n=1 Tax=Streptomyces sp. enrichment culture TaxID=1795815 RepID=UPI003F5793CB
MKTRSLIPVKSALLAGAVTLSGLGFGLATAGPAAAYAGYCNSTASKPLVSGWSTQVPSYGSNIDCYMNKGAQSSAVTVLQKALKYCYSQELGVDGIFGNDTRTALINAQSRERIDADGGYGSQTRQALKWYSSSSDTCASLKK